MKERRGRGPTRKGSDWRSKPCRSRCSRRNKTSDCVGAEQCKACVSGQRSVGFGWASRAAAGPGAKRRRSLAVAKAHVMHEAALVLVGPTSTLKSTYIHTDGRRSRHPTSVADLPTSRDHTRATSTNTRTPPPPLPILSCQRSPPTNSARRDPPWSDAE